MMAKRAKAKTVEVKASHVAYIRLFRRKQPSSSKSLPQVPISNVNRPPCGIYDCKGDYLPDRESLALMTH
jgi:hypothetical protein